MLAETEQTKTNEDKRQSFRSKRETVWDRVNELKERVKKQSKRTFVVEGFDPNSGNEEQARQVRCFLANGNLTTNLNVLGASEITYAKGVIVRDKEKDPNGASEPMFGLDLGRVFTVDLNNGIESVRLNQLSDVTREKDLEHNILTTRFTWNGSTGRRMSVEARQFLSYADPHLAVIEYSFTPHYTGKAEIEMGVSIRRPKSEDDTDFIQQADAKQLPNRRGIYCTAETIDQEQSLKHSYAIAQRSEAYSGKGEAKKSITPQKGTALEYNYFLDELDKRAASELFSFDVKEGETYTVRSVKAVITSQNPELAKNQDPRDACIAEIEQVESVDKLEENHKQSMERHLESMPLYIEGDTEIQEGIWFNTGNIAADVRIGYTNASLGPKQNPFREKGGYRTLSFRDAEQYNLRQFNAQPELIRNHLEYRYKLLENARRKAKKVLREFRLLQARTPEERARAEIINKERENIDEGALMMWESGAPIPAEKDMEPEGGPEFLMRKVLDPLDPNKKRLIDERVKVHALDKEVFINADIVDVILHYYRLTDNQEWMRTKGAEMLLSFARFYGNRATPITEIAENGQKTVVRYEVEDMEDSDEYHGNVKNGAETLIKMKRVMKAAVEAIRYKMASADVLEKLKISSEEFALWEDMAEKTYIPINRSGEIIPFDGFDRLIRVNLSLPQYRGKTEIDTVLLAEGKNPEDHTPSKQPAGTLTLEFEHELLELLHPRILEDMRNDMRAEMLAAGIAESNITDESLDLRVLAKIVTVNIERLDPDIVDGSSLSPGRRRLHDLLYERYRKLLPKKRVRKSPNKILAEYKKKTLNMDRTEKSDSHKTRDGLHTANEGLSEMVITNGFGGIRHGRDALYMSPQLPDGIKRIYYSAPYRGAEVHMLFTGRKAGRKEVEVFLREPNEEAVVRGLPVMVDGKKVYLNEENGYYYSTRSRKKKNIKKQVA